MLYPLKIVDIELSRPLVTIENLDGYMGVQGLVRLHNVPVGTVKAPIVNGCCLATTLKKLILAEHSWTIIKQLLENGLGAALKPEELRLENLWTVPPPEYTEDYPLVTVAVCTRDRSSDLALCLESLEQLDYPHLDILVVDNAPTNDATKKLVPNFPAVRYVCEPRPGLNWARNRAILEAKGDIIAYTDDDVVVDPGWVKALAQIFAENPEVMAVTGLVVPYELETEAQVLFEKYGGFGRGFERQWYRVGRGQMPWQLLGTGQFGTGANMAYRRCVFTEIGVFDPALDVGTVTNGCGDLEMFLRVLKGGHTLVYEPRAVIRHRHRREYTRLRSQITNNGIGLYAYFVCGALAYREERLSFVKIGLWWLLYWHLRRLWITLKHPTQLPRDLVVAELKGVFIGLTRYPKARRNAAHIATTFGLLTPVEPGTSVSAQSPAEGGSSGMAVRRVELNQPIHPLTDVTDSLQVRIFITCNDEPLGSADIVHQYQPVSAARLREALVNAVAPQLLYRDSDLSTAVCWSQAQTALQNRLSVQSQAATSSRLPDPVAITINLATFDRPDDLRNCLRCLMAQITSRPVEIIVVDNHPASGLTPPVVAEFPGVKLVSEERQGLAYARNAGFVASTGDIVVATDDDVTVPPDWLEKLLAPFARPDVMVVTGHVLPIELETSPQQFFETYGGLGRGFDPKEVDGEWLESSPRIAIPTWSLGATANAAFRASMLHHPQIGLMEETLGPGMPSGVGEDTYLFYKVLKAGYTLIYEPRAYVWHKHRRQLESLRRQIYGYSKGHVSYNLTTWLLDGDWRGLVQILVALPIYHAEQIKNRLLGQSTYPLSLVGLEITGNLAGPWSLWQSYQRVKREGRSRPYLPVAERSGEESQARQTVDHLATSN
ncbi:MAG: glycosyltransferase [Cyanophyceae cyanobacterium]